MLCRPVILTRLMPSVPVVPVVVTAVIAISWYAAVEWTYFSVQGDTFRKVFAAANGSSPSEFTYRAPWLGLITYTVLLSAFALLAVVPAIRDSCKPYLRPSQCARRAYIGCLWRSVVLAAAVYVTYDFTTFSTLFSFDLIHAVTDVAYGIFIVPSFVMAPTASILAYQLSD